MYFVKTINGIVVTYDDNAGTISLHQLAEHELPGWVKLTTDTFEQIAELVKSEL